MTRLAVVTGSNKGIGFNIVRGLISKGGDDLKVVLCARTVSNGEAALEKLSTEYGEKAKAVSVEQLDISDSTSIAAFKKTIAEKYGGVIDILVHNAGIHIRGPVAEIGPKTMLLNYKATFDVNTALEEFVRKSTDARIVTVSSVVGKYVLYKCSEGMQKRYKEMSTIEEVEEVCKEFLDAVEKGGDAEAKAKGFTEEFEVNGFPMLSYGLSKLNQMKRFNIYAGLAENKNIFVATMCPGFTQTDMTAHHGAHSAEHGASTAVYLALKSKAEIASEGIKTGQFWEESKITTYV